MDEKLTMRLLEACGFKCEVSAGMNPCYELPYAFSVPYFRKKNVFYITNPGKWPKSNYAWDAPGAEMTPNELFDYLISLVETANDLKLKRKHVGMALQLYGSHTAAVSKGWANLTYTFESCLQVAADAPEALPILAVCFQHGLPDDVIMAIFRGEQDLNIMLDLYAREEPANP